MRIHVGYIRWAVIAVNLTLTFLLWKTTLNAFPWVSVLLNRAVPFLVSPRRAMDLNPKVFKRPDYDSYKALTTKAAEPPRQPAALVNIVRGLEATPPEPAPVIVPDPVDPEEPGVDELAGGPLDDEWEIGIIFLYPDPEDNRAVIREKTQDKVAPVFRTSHRVIRPATRPRPGTRTVPTKAVKEKQLVVGDTWTYDGKEIKVVSIEGRPDRIVYEVGTTPYSLKREEEERDPLVIKGDVEDEEGEGKKTSSEGDEEKGGFARPGEKDVSSDSAEKPERPSGKAVVDRTVTKKDLDELRKVLKEAGDKLTPSERRQIEEAIRGKKSPRPPRS